MAENTKISWAHHTFNCWRGCSKISEGCRNCYAEAFSGRNPSVLGVWGPNGTRVVAADAAWKEPLKWDRAAKAAGERHRVFCASLADVFEGPDTMPAESWDAVTQARKRLGKLILDTPNLTWMLLTKRPQNILPISADMWVRFGGPTTPLPDNVWIGVSVENQQTADERIPRLLKVPARVRFLSCEPLLGPVDLTSYGVGTNSTWHDWLSGTEERPGQFRRRGEKVDWVIVGGESGPNARPMHPKWARSLRDQCKSAGVAFHFKQWGEYATSTVMPADRVLVGKRWEEGMPDSEADEVVMYRVGKENAGRILDGRTWDEVPS